MEGRSWLVLALLVVVVPWLVIFVDAAIGFNFGLSLVMLLIFSIGLMFLAASAEGA